MKINTSRKAGFTLVEIMIVVAIIGLLAAIAIPNFVKARATAQKNGCINNLRQIDAAKQQYCLEANVGAAVAVSEANIAPYLGRDITATTLATAKVFCPSAGTYTLNNSSTAPTCSKGSSDGHALP